MPSAYKLLILDGPQRGQEFEIRAARVILGRDPQTDVAIAHDPKVALFHAQLLWEHGQYWIEDMPGAAPTRVYGVPARKRTPLFHRDVVSVGATRLCIVNRDTDCGRVLKDFSPQRPLSTPTAADHAFHVAPPSPDDDVAVTATADPRVARLSFHGATETVAVERVHARMRVIHDVAGAMAGKVDPADLLGAVLDHLSRVVAAERAFAFTFADGQPVESFTPLVIRDRRAAGVAPTSGYRIGASVLRKALRERLAILIDDTLASTFDGSQSLIGSAARSVLCVPLVHQDVVTSLIYLDSSEPHAFDREDLELVTVIASQVAAGLANAHLYERLRLAYHELETAHDQLLSAEKLTTIGTLAASLSHDLSNVLTPITGVALMVMESSDVEPQLKAAFERQMERLKALSQQLMSFATPQPPVLVPVDLNRAVLDSLDLVRTEARYHKVEILTELASELPLAAADIYRLEQAFLNLMINAIQAMEAGGGGTLTIRTHASAGHVDIAFADTGPGILESHLPLIFKPFFTTKGRDGNGLGLHGCRRIVEDEHGGRIEVTSRLGEGTTFTLRIPQGPRG